MDPDSAGSTPAPRFCDQCAQSLIPLTVPHVARDCGTCGQTIHIVEPGEGGKGIQIRKGDRFTIPAGSISISLDPRRSSGRLARAGLTWMMRMVLTSNVPKTVEGLDSMLDLWEEEADKILEDSAQLSDYDLEDEDDVLRVIDMLKDDQKSLEFWAMAVASCSQELRKRLKDEDPQGAVLYAVRLATWRALMVFIRDLEEHAWTGYNQNQLIYGIAQAGATTPAEAHAIAALEPIFKGLSEDVLHAWVDSGVDIGHRIGVTQVDETLLKALAKYHLGLFDRRRSEQQIANENNARFWTLIISGFGAGATVTGAAVLVLRTVGVL